MRRRPAARARAIAWAASVPVASASDRAGRSARKSRPGISETRRIAVLAGRIVSTARSVVEASAARRRACKLTHFIAARAARPAVPDNSAAKAHARSRSFPRPATIFAVGRQPFALEGMAVRPVATAGIVASMEFAVRRRRHAATPVANLAPFANAANVCPISPPAPGTTIAVRVHACPAIAALQRRFARTPTATRPVDRDLHCDRVPTGAPGSRVRLTRRISTRLLPRAGGWIRDRANPGSAPRNTQSQWQPAPGNRR